MRKRAMSTIAATNSLFEIDVELDSLLDEIEEQTAQEGSPSEELVARFQQFCSAHDEKVDRIGRFLRQMEVREQFCRSEAAAAIRAMGEHDCVYVFDRRFESIGASQVADHRFCFRGKTARFLGAAHKRANRMPLAKRLFNHQNSNATCCANHQYSHELITHDVVTSSIARSPFSVLGYPINSNN